MNQTNSQIGWRQTCELGMICELQREWQRKDTA